MPYRGQRSDYSDTPPATSAKLKQWRMSVSSSVSGVVRLQSNDGEVFVVRMEAARTSRMLATMLDGKVCVCVCVCVCIVLYTIVKNTVSL